MRSLVAVCALAACGRVGFDASRVEIDANGGASVCGDMTRESGEVCDDGNVLSGDGCSADCVSNETCGNGVTDIATGETCDDMNAIASDGCSRTCQSNEACGNGITDPSEACDSMNQFTATCDPDCTAVVCGDGVKNAVATEQCDDGNMLDTDACVGTCSLARCGDAFVRTGFEQCDLGASNSNASNAMCRTDCKHRRCGDAVLDNTFGEVCDDGNIVSGDGCSDTCMSSEVCGNGILDAARGEGCDLGGANSSAPNAACRTNCQPRRCGDAVIDNSFGEVCDDGNLLDGDGCNSTCTGT